MDETKQDDTTNRRQTGPVRIPRPNQGEIADILCATGHAYQVVYSQESTWMFYLRLATIDGDDIGIVRVVLGPKGPTGGRGEHVIDFFPRREGDDRLI